MDNLRYKSVFDIIGPVMIGPSSSHTAGAARIGKIVRSIFGELPEKLEIHLYESFAKTYKGHGTDVALVAGVLGMDTDDERLPMAPQLAYEQGMEISYVPHPEERADHPNTARLIAKKGDRTVTGISIGGGMIQVTELNGFDIAISAGVPTFVVIHEDVPGMIARVSSLLSEHQINIAQMNVTREAKGEKAIMILEVDTPNVKEVIGEMKLIPRLHAINFFN
ncbi:L-serine dehydratase beta subunit [Lactococcus cremoris subsp. cremoris UC509.9]|uniref:L-serine ammonia-lyase, iron-sulfur-dependent subunit beta n=1 Tax=Lactococcus lactis subsp. cremoris TaxID=1359 RepID=UPI00029B5D61|nr:L-serine ammonia-lyase, iron-sulfur-dependent subunit beta [Lactococcus cremoris]AFW91427.1 L-serine dehydratase beta subunit [Lactococcus cremoris subsp. cremoris UC509.9]